MKNRCRICKNDAGDYRICRSCYEAAFVPCSNCGKQTQSITLFGKEAVKTCRACTSHFNANTHRIGKTCLVCDKRFQSMKKANAKSVCDNCMKITKPCEYCGKATPKYKEKGGQRKYCSLSCSAKAISSSIRSIASTKANITKRTNNPPKTKQNKLARRHPKYIEWRKTVFERDDYTCQDCGTHGGELHPHHIKAFAKYIELRYEVSNGVTLCKGCHRKRHNHVFIGRTKRASVQ